MTWPESADWPGTGTPASREPIAGVKGSMESVYQEQEGASGRCRLDQQPGSLRDQVPTLGIHMNDPSVR